MVLSSCDSGGVDTGGGGEEPEPATVRFSSEGATVSEGDSVATVTVEIADADDASVSVDVVFDGEGSEASAADVEDYATASVSFPAGAADGTTRDVTVTLTDDDEAESTETATFALKNATGDAEIGTPGRFDLDIEDNDEGDDEDFTAVEILAMDCPAELETGERGTFTATINEGEATTPVSSEWAFDDDTGATGLVATKTYDEAGTYEITFTASNEDSDGNERSDSQTCTTEVMEPAAPAMIASVNASPNPSDVGESVSFTAEVEGDEPIECEWDFDDGTTATDCDASHTYDAAGSYDVTLTASNDAGSDTATLTHEVQASNPNVLFVDADASGAGNGSSWEGAFSSLQGALDAADAGMEIWVAEGTYYPDQGQTSGDRSATFRLESDVALYGGFGGNENSRDARNPDPESNGTVLSGDLGTEDFPNDNSYHVVTAGGTNQNAVLDGFTITAGRADDFGDRAGAGMLLVGGNPTLRNLLFSGNAAKIGGGLFTKQGNPLIENVIFRENTAGSEGGGMYNTQGSPALRNVLFDSNIARRGGGVFNEDSAPQLLNTAFYGNDARSGAGMYNEGSNASPALINVVFSGNMAERLGGGVYNGNAHPTFINATFSENTAENGGAVFNQYVSDDTPVVVRNSIFWGNTASDDGDQFDSSYSSEALFIAYSLVEGGIPEWAVSGGNNRGTDPRFVDPNGSDNIIGTPDDNPRLQSGSPALNAGDNGALPSDEQDLDGDGNTTERLPLDLDGEARIQNGTVDLGAYEGGD